MPHPIPSWIDRLPQNCLIAEYSVWSADLIRLADNLDRIAPHADILHVDVADGVFAPSFLFFLDLVARMWAVTAIPIHVRLMVADAVLLSQVAQFAEAEADLISLHVENAAVAADASDLIEGAGLKAGMVLWVETSVATVMPLLGRFDFLTQLGTAIGVKGQGLDPAATARLIEAAGLIKAGDRRVVLAADGGKRDTTVPPLRAAGAETMVMGSLAFGAADLGEWMRWLHGL